MQAASPTVKHLVLVGGGHSHLSVLRKFGMQPLPGLAITLISREIITPYSGSLPGYLAGSYQHQQMHIDLRPLARFANAAIIQQEVSRIDLASKTVALEGRPDIPFDILSLNIGSRPDHASIIGAGEFATAVKPIDGFISRWESWRQAIISALNAGGSFSLAIIGGGPASVELAFATRYRLAMECGLDMKQDQRFKITVVSADPYILASHNSRARDFAATELERRNITLLLNTRVVECRSGELVMENQQTLNVDAIVYATGAGVADWPFECGLQRSRDGFISIHPSLQTVSHDSVFAAGDAATIVDEPRPKSGVYAVRQGKVLAENLRRYATGRSLKNYLPQKQALALMSMGNGKAIATRGQWFMQGRSMWHLKHRIDTGFVQKYSQLPAMELKPLHAKGLVDSETEAALRQHAMRCAGCGAKLSSDVLAEVLLELELIRPGDVVQTTGGIEDAAQIRLPDGGLLLQSLDYLRSFIDDPWLFARIATIHCLGDIHAMGIQPHSALAMVGVPFASKRYSRQQLRQIMQGCAQELNAAGCALVGGHSAESAELQFGLCVNGFADPNSNEVLGKDRGRAGDVLILTKALGTGALLAADMRCQASQRWMQEALQSMLLSSADATTILVRHGARACTDITGFGLAGHLLEIVQASGCNAELAPGSVSELPGAMTCIENNIVSSLHEENKQVTRHLIKPDACLDQTRLQLLFDPQTAGGLLCSLPQENADTCLTALHQAGYQQAAIIGRLTQRTDQPDRIVLVQATLQ